MARRSRLERSSGWKRGNPPARDRIRFLLGLALLAAAGCSSPSAERFESAIRFPEQQPRETLQTADLFRRLEIARTDFAGPLPGAWAITSNADTASTSPAGLRFSAPRPGGVVSWQGRLEAASVDWIEIDALGMVGVAWVELDWRGRSGGEPRSGHLELSARDLGDRASEFLFHVAASPAWSGTIDQLSVRLANPHSDRTVLRSIAFHREELAREALSRANGRAWRIESGHEVRDGFVVGVDRPFSIPIEGERRTRLRFGLASLGSSAGRVLVVLEAGGPPGARIRRQELDRIEVAPSSGGWVDRTLEIPAADGGGPRRVTLQWNEGAPDRSLVAIGGIRIEDAGGGFELPDIVVISVDTLRADRLSLYGNARLTSPQLDAFFASGGVVFERAIAAAPSTLPSHASIFTGRNVLSHGAYLDQPLDPSFESLAEVLARAGYESIAVTGGGYLHPFYGLDRGFSRYYHFPRRSGRSDFDLDDGVRRVVSLLAEEARGPRFLFLHTYDVHAPYRPREPYSSRWGVAPGIDSIQPLASGALAAKWPTVHEASGSSRPLRVGEEQLVIDVYDTGVVAMDRELAPLWDELENAERRRGSIAVFLSDHGESFGEAGRWEHGHLSDDNLRVPLAFRLSGARGPERRIARRVALVDLLPTLADLVRIDAPAGVDGRTLAAEVGGVGANGSSEETSVQSYSGEAANGLALMRGDWKLVLRDALARLDRPSSGWNLASDPAESEPIVDVGAVRPLRDLLAEARRELARSRAGARVELANEEDRPIRVELEGAELRSYAVAWAGGAIPEQVAAAEGRLGFDLPARSRVRLRLPVRELRDGLSVRLSDRGARSEALRVAPGPSGFEVTASSTRTIDVRVSVLWSGSGGAEGVSEGELAEAERQIRALGYL